MTYCNDADSSSHDILIRSASVFETNCNL